MDNLDVDAFVKIVEKELEKKSNGDIRSPIPLTKAKNSSFYFNKEEKVQVPLTADFDTSNKDLNTALKNYSNL